MQIDSVTIHNFRSIQDATLSFQDYSIIVGENNVGKSNIIDAIRCFYGDIEFKEDDFCRACNTKPKKNTSQKDNKKVAWIEIEYNLTDKEYGALPKKYQITANKLRIRKDLSGTGAFYGYTKEGLETSTFCGQRNSIPTNLGHIIYVPAVVDVNGNTKTSGTTALNNLISLICQNPSFQKEMDIHLQSAIRSLNLVTSPKLKSISQAINNEIKSSGVNVNIGTRKFTTEEILKFLLNINVDDGVGPMDLSKIGTGVQRRIIASLIKLNAHYTSISERHKKKRRFTSEDFQSATEKLTANLTLNTVAQEKATHRFRPRMDLLLFEEPEVSLHPAAIADLAHDLHDFAKTHNQQVIATTHSSQLVSEDIMDIRGLIRVEKQKNRTVTYQNQIPDADLQMAKNMVYFDRPRSDMFFAKKVILVEGPTEYMLYNYLKRRGDLPHSLTQNVTLIETVGKWSMPYFLKVLNNYNIRHAVLYDTDGDPNRQDNIDVRNQFSALTEYSYGFPRDIETFCGIRKSGNPAINIINKFEDGTVDASTQAAVVQIFKDIITKHR